MKLSYSLDGPGWATVVIRDGRSEFSITVSYLHDSLCNLAQSAVDLRDGEASSIVVFMDEPGEHHLVLSRSDDDALHVELQWFDDWASWDMYPADQFEVVYKGQTNVKEFVAAVSIVLNSVLAEWGIDGYKKKWIEHPFPKKLHKKLDVTE
ncbi:MAG: hypothetical protein AAGA25_04280 [Planctomycetota bacterium]